MRWRKPKEGDVRYRTVFAFFPITAPNCFDIMERRWWEWVTIKQVYREKYYDKYLGSLPAGWETVKVLD
jgi:hypothetical protein